MAKTKIKYEITKYDRAQILTLESPAEITFINISSIIGAQVVINQNLTLDSVRDTNSGIAINPNSVNMKNNENEEDTTNYQLQFPANEGILLVIAKYFV